MKSKYVKFIFITLFLLFSFFIKELISLTKDSKLALNYMTHQMCSCLFIMSHNETFCRKIIENKYLSPQINVDYKKKSVSGSLVYLINSEIYFENKYLGCNFSPLMKKT